MQAAKDFSTKTDKEKKAILGAALVDKSTTNTINTNDDNNDNDDRNSYIVFLLKLTNM
jgi:hypothetical protein